MVNEPDKLKIRRIQFQYLAKTLSLATEFGFIIALPLIGLGLLGKWLDAMYNTKYFVLVGVLLAIFASTVWISRRLKGIMEELKK